MSYATIDDLRSQLGMRPSAKHDPAYVAKMMHEVPDAAEVDRVAWLVERCRGKRVLEFGASGPAHEAIRQAAAQVVGVDRSAAPGVIAFDLDDVAQRDLAKPEMEIDHGLAAADVDVIVCGETLEHLANPGWFLQRLRRQCPGTPVLITVPNAFTEVARTHLRHGIENVNRDHVAWYSWKTLSTLLGRYGYTVREFYWYGGTGPTAQGLVVVAG